MVKARVLLLSLTCVFFSALLVSCLPKTGHISWQASDEVESALSRGQLQPGLTYYYSGPEALPHTIIGILSDLPFQQNFWQPVQFGAMQVKEWLAAIDNAHRDVTDMYYGGELLDRKGNYLGIWYSKHRFYSGYLDNDGKLIVLRPLRHEKKLLLKHLSK